MKCMPVALFVALSLLSCFGQNSESYLACNKKANTQADMNVCAGQEAERVDADLNKAYRQLLAKAGSDQNAVTKIKAAERAWVAYRDAYVEAMYPAKDK